MTALQEDNHIFESPIGSILIQANSVGLTQVTFSNETRTNEVEVKVNKGPFFKELNAHIAAATLQLTEYFQGNRQIFSIPIDFQGTDFQKQVWQQLQRIPFGTSVSYSTIAERMNQPTAVRAIGLANSKNPILIITPCHRVIAKNQQLSGYAGGIDKKAWLLKHEGIDFK
jgi:O-6-methylguanine DNA methyltransferase